MTGIILVCRMSSSRLPGKTLLDFGGQSLLGHIVSRIECAGIERSSIVICTSTAQEDSAILDAASGLGCRQFAGSLENVSKRILDAAEFHGIEEFCLILGDNAWIDPDQIQAVCRASNEAGKTHDYIVTATPELAYCPEDEPYYPIGTRIQYIRRRFMEERLTELNSESVREHTSRLFLCLPNGTRYGVLYTPDGLAKARIGALNISINTREDYEMALAALKHVGDPHAPTSAVTAFHLDRAADQGSL